AIAGTADDSRMFVGYEALLDDPYAACADLAKFLGVPARASEAGVRREIDSWVAPGMRHHVRTPAELLEDPRLGRLDVSLALLLDLTTGAGAHDAGHYADALNMVAARVLESAATPVTTDG